MVGGLGVADPIQASPFGLLRLHSVRSGEEEESESETSELSKLR